MTPPASATSGRWLAGLYALLAAGCLLALALDRRPPAGAVVRVALLGSTADEDYAGANALKAHVEAASGGELRVEIYTAGQYCGSPRECIDFMQAGALDVFMTTFGGLATIHPPAQALDLPYLFRNDAEAECVLDGPLAEQLGESVLTRTNLRLMAIGNTGGWRNFATTRRPVRRAEDLAGLKIRTTAAPIEQELVRELGASPTPIAWSELYAALATGVVAGTKNSVQDLVGMRFEEQIKHIVLDRHGYMGAIWWFAEPRWSRLPPDDQEILREGFAKLKETTRRLPKETEAAGYATFRNAGGTVHDPSSDELRSFEAAASAVRGWYEERHGLEWTAMIDEAVAACRAIEEGAPQPD